MFLSFCSAGSEKGLSPWTVCQRDNMPLQGWEWWPVPQEPLYPHTLFQMLLPPASGEDKIRH